MSSTNKTTYYELPQYVDNDIFNPLVDDNDAYNKIDTALHNIANAEADNTSEIVGIKGRLDSAEGDIVALETQNGNSVLTTTAQTLSGAINEVNAEADALAGRVTVVEGDINNASTGLKVKVNALETQNGSATLTTTAQTLSGAVNELDGDIGNANTAISALQSTVADIPTKRKYILIGDSFGYGVVGGGAPRGTGWLDGFALNQPDGTAIYLNDTEVEALEGVAGFCSSLPFEDILEEINDTKFPNNDQATVTDIVVLGGSNDFGVGATASQIDTAIHSFVTYANTHFPNAKIKIGVLMKRIYDGFLVGIPSSYAQCQKYNAEYISDTLGLCIMPEYYSADGTHLTASGYSFYQRFINDAIVCGRCHYSFEFTTTLSLDVDSAFTIDDGFSARFYCTEKMIKISFYRTSTNRGWPLEFQSVPVNNATLNSAITLDTAVELPFRYKHGTAFNVYHEKTISGVKVLSHAQDGFIYNTDKQHFTFAVGASIANPSSVDIDRAVVNINPEQAIWVEY